MEYKNIFKNDINYKTIFMLALLAILPNLLGMINIPTIFGFKIHTFQYVVFIAAAIYGPFGGAISGGIGSMFSAFAMNNPYIVGGNILLGFAAGFLMRRGFGIIKSAMAAYAIQIPFLFVTDVYLVGMPAFVVFQLMIALLFSNMIFSVLAKYTYKPIEKASA